MEVTKSASSAYSMSSSRMITASCYRRGSRDVAVSHTASEDDVGSDCDADRYSSTFGAIIVKTISDRTV